MMIEHKIKFLKAYNTNLGVGGKIIKSPTKKFKIKIDSFILGALLGTIISTLFIFVVRYLQYDEYLTVTTTHPSIWRERILSNMQSSVKSLNDSRVLCWVLTHPDNYYNALSVNNTWGQHCDKLLFISTDLTDGLDVVKVNVTEGRTNLWGKTKRALEHIYENYLDSYDWFLKADDDTFVIIENLKYLLYSYSPDMPIYFGCKLRPFVDQVRPFLLINYETRANEIFYWLYRFEFC